MVKVKFNPCPAESDMPCLCHILSGLIWVQTVCKGFQQTTKVATGGERVKRKEFTLRGANSFILEWTHFQKRTKKKKKKKIKTVLKE